VPEVRERENFYGNMMWIVDGGTACEICGKPVIESPTLLGKSPYPVERWVSKNRKFYFKWRGESRAWVNAITKPLWFHFDELGIFTYKWIVEQSDTPRLSHGKMTYNTYHKTRFHDVKYLTLRDAMVLLEGKFCRVMRRAGFLKSHFGAHPSSQNSLFDF